MRILHVLDHSLPMQSGYSFRTRALMRAQQALGWTVVGLTGVRHTAPGSGQEVIDGLSFHRTKVNGVKDEGPKRASSRLAGVAELFEVGRLVRAIIRQARSSQIDVLHVHSPPLNGLAGFVAARWLNLPMVYEIRAFWEDAAVGNKTDREGSGRYRLVRALENFVIRRADAVVTICDGLRDDLIARGHAPHRLTVVPNAVDLTLFGAPPARDAALAAELGCAEGDVIGFVGSFYAYEGLDDLIAAMPFLRQKRPQARLILVGGGPEEDALRLQAAASPAQAHILFAGRVPHDQVERYYSLMDVLAYPRKQMRLTALVTPLKPLEAMAQMRLVAASDIGGHRELILDGETGVLFPPDTPEALADSLARLLADKAGQKRMRKAARAFVAQERDWDQNARRYEPVYHRLAKSRLGGP